MMMDMNGKTKIIEPVFRAHQMHTNDIVTNQREYQVS